MNPPSRETQTFWLQQDLTTISGEFYWLPFSSRRLLLLELGLQLPQRASLVYGNVLKELLPRHGVAKCDLVAGVPDRWTWMISGLNPVRF